MRLSTIESAAFSSLGNLKLCELEEVKQNYLCNLLTVDADIFLLTERLDEAINSEDREQAKTIKKELKEVCENRDVMTAKLRALNRRVSLLEQDHRLPGFCRNKTAENKPVLGYA